jgi:hypothetical protein
VGHRLFWRFCNIPLVPLRQGCTNPGSRIARASTFLLRRRLIFVGPHNITCFLSLFRRLEYGWGSKIFFSPNLCTLALGTWWDSTWITARPLPSKLFQIHHSRFTGAVNKTYIKTLSTYIRQPTSHFPWPIPAKLNYVILITLIRQVTMRFGRYRVRILYCPSWVWAVNVHFGMKHLQSRPYTDTRGTDTFVKLATSVTMTRNVTSHCIQQRRKFLRRWQSLNCARNSATSMNIHWTRVTWIPFIASHPIRSILISSSHLHTRAQDRIHLSFSRHEQHISRSFHPCPLRDHANTFPPHFTPALYVITLTHFPLISPLPFTWSR